jgi:hypothetical protein
MEDQNQVKTYERPKKSLWIMYEFYIDFLGSLVPGLLVVVLSSVVLWWSSKILCSSLCAFTDNTPSIVLSDWRNLELGAYGTSAVALILGYVLGSMFYRQDPKVPDYRSAKLVWRYTKSEEDRKKLAVQPRSEHEEDISPNDAQFPYYFLYEYLDGRGLKRLADWVPWRGNDKNTWEYRTKMFINQIKIRLQFLVPERCRDIVRNEAHVRLATSLWYATRWLIVVSWIGIVLIIVTLIVSWPELKLYYFAGALEFNLLVFTLALLTKLKIEKFIHYLRVREIVYVLETADFAVRNGYDLHQEDFKSRKIS